MIYINAKPMATLTEYVIQPLKEEFDRLKKQTEVRVVTVEELVKMNPELFWLNPIRRENAERLAEKIVAAIMRDEEKVGGSEEIYDLANSIRRQGVLAPIMMTKCGDKLTIIDGNMRFIVLREFYRNGVKDIPITVLIMPWCFDKSNPTEYAKALLMAFAIHTIGTRTLPVAIPNDQIVQVVADGLIAYTYGALAAKGKDTELIDALSNADVAKLLNLLKPLAREVGIQTSVVETFISIVKTNKDVREKVVSALQNGEYMTPTLKPIVKNIITASKEQEHKVLKSQGDEISNLAIGSTPPTQPVSPPATPPPSSGALPPPPPRVVPPPPPPPTQQQQQQQQQQPIIVRGRVETPGDKAAELMQKKRVPQDVADIIDRIMSADIRNAAYEAAADHRWTKDDAALLIALPGFIKSHHIRCVAEDGSLRDCNSDDIADIMMKAITKISTYRETAREAPDAFAIIADEVEFYTGEKNYKFTIREIKLYALARGISPLTAERTIASFAKVVYDLLEKGRVDLIEDLDKALRARAYEELPGIFREIAAALSPVPPK
mgnify:CR=1 FL=1